MNDEKVDLKYTEFLALDKKGRLIHIPMYQASGRSFSHHYEQDKQPHFAEDCPLKEQAEVGIPTTAQCNRHVTA